MLAFLYQIHWKYDFRMHLHVRFAAGKKRQVNCSVSEILQQIMKMFLLNRTKSLKATMQLRVAFLDSHKTQHFGFRLLNLVENALHKSHMSMQLKQTIHI